MKKKRSVNIRSHDPRMECMYGVQEGVLEVPDGSVKLAIGLSFSACHRKRN